MFQKIIYFVLLGRIYTQEYNLNSEKMKNVANEFQDHSNIIGRYFERRIESFDKQKRHFVEECIGVKNIEDTITKFKIQLDKIVSRANSAIRTTVEKKRIRCIKNAANKTEESINTIVKKYKNNVDLFAAELLESIQTNQGNLEVYCDSDINEIKNVEGVIFFKTCHNITKELQKERNKFFLAARKCN